RVEQSPAPLLRHEPDAVRAVRKVDLAAGMEPYAVLVHATADQRRRRVDVVRPGQQPGDAVVAGRIVDVDRGFEHGGDQRTRRRRVLPHEIEGRAEYLFRVMVPDRLRRYRDAADALGLCPGVPGLAGAVAVDLA